MIRKAAIDSPTSAAGGPTAPIGDMPGSDDSNASDGMAGEEDLALGPSREEDESSEEEEPMEEDGALATSSLIDIILDGADDLLTLEEAYSTLAQRLRLRLTKQSNEIAPVSELELRQLVRPIREQAPAVVRAFQRDLQRLLGKVPLSETPPASDDRSSSPFRNLLPLQDTTPDNKRQLTPSPTPAIGKASPNKPSRQGYSEAEVRYRREASGVGSAALRLLAFVLHTPELYSCFTDADIQALIDHVLVIPRTPKMPTPNPKRTYYLAVMVLAQLQVPVACVQPIKDKIARAVEAALNDSFAFMSATAGKEGPSIVKKEGFAAVINLLISYPGVFFQHYGDFLPVSIRDLSSPVAAIRYKAGNALAAFAMAKHNLFAEYREALLTNKSRESREAFLRFKGLSQKSEVFVVSQLKSGARSLGRSSPVYGANGERRTEWVATEHTFREKVGLNDEVHWACAAWAVLVTLIGSQYNSSTLADPINHIIDRSLQPTTNTVRPPLARFAWNHAIHAYLSPGSTVSVSDDCRIVQSHRPFVNSGQQDAASRLETLLFPARLAVDMANDMSTVHRELVLLDNQTGEAQCSWQRSQKTRKQQWMVTCGKGLTSIIYAFAGIALTHEEQPAKEMVALTGLPSSDGPAPPASAYTEARFELQDQTWDKVIRPLLSDYFSILGSDDLKLEAWAILEALTSPNPTSSWDLDRLLNERYMSGEVFQIEKDKDAAIAQLILDLAVDSVQPSEVPSWGVAWVASRLDKLLDLFQEAVAGIHGLNNAPEESIEFLDGVILPNSLSSMWSNMMSCLAAVQSMDSTSYNDGLRLVSRHLLKIFNREPTSHLPICYIGRDDTFALHPAAARIHIFAHLLNSALSHLGQAASSSFFARAAVTGDDEDQADLLVQQTAFGANAAGETSLAGCLLGQLLRTKVLTGELPKATRQTLHGINSLLLDDACAEGVVGQVLGEVTNVLPSAFEGVEDLQLDLWRLVASKWTKVIHLVPSTTASGTDHTGVLLVSLLSAPFRTGSIDSAWHQESTAEDLRIWEGLLETTILRFRAKRVGTNMGVLETLAGHFSDYLPDEEKTRSTTITLSCLTAAVRWVPSGLMEDNSPSQHFNGPVVPLDFLEFINDSLLQAFPDFESPPTSVPPIAISPAVFQLLNALVDVIATVPLSSVGEIIDTVKLSLARWFALPAVLADESQAVLLDSLYVSLFSVLGNGIASRHVTADSALVNGLFDLYAHRINLATSRAVLESFQSFWQGTFARVSGLEYEEHVVDFLGQLTGALKDFIYAPGLSIPQASLSEEESLARYPHCEPYIVSARDVPPTPSEPVQLDVEMPQASGEYDADVSASLGTAPVAVALKTSDLEPIVEEIDLSRIEDTRIEESPPTVMADSHEPESLQSSLAPSESGETGSDVFGPTAVAKGKSRKSKKTKKGRASRKSTQTTGHVQKHVRPSSPPQTLESGDVLITASDPPSSASPISKKRKLTLDIEVANGPQPDPSNEVRQLEGGVPAGANRSFIASASKWLGRFPSIGGLFSPSLPSSGSPFSTADGQAEAPQIQRSQSVSAIGHQLSDAPATSIPSIGSTVSAIERPIKRRRQQASAPEGSDAPVSSASPFKTRSGLRRSEDSSAAKPRLSRSKSSSAVASRARILARSRSSSVGTHQDEPIIIEDEEVEVTGADEDELILSPESARRSRAEEREAIRQSTAGTPPPALVPSAPAPVPAADANVTQESSGRFDDAPSPLAQRVAQAEAQIPTTSLETQAVLGIASPLKRSAEQARVLAIVEEAARAREAVAGLDFQGVLDLMKNSGPD